MNIKEMLKEMGQENGIGNILEGQLGEFMANMAHECMRDANAIASSAISLAADRSSDLGMRPVVTFFVLKYLLQLNIDLQSEDLWEALHADHKDVPKSVHLKAMARMEKEVIDLVKANATTHKVQVG